jgi:hypothetical protein
MRKLGLALFLTLLGFAPAQAQPVIPLTQASIPITISTATTTQLVALKAGQSIYVTSISIIAAGTGNIQLVYGTGTACATGQGNVTGNYSLTTQVGFTLGNGSGVVLVVPQGAALCAVTSGAVGMPGSLSYAQF